MRAAACLVLAIALPGCGSGAPPTLPPPPPPTTLAPPAAPEPLSPPDGAVFGHFPRTVTLEWSPVPRAETYTLEIEACLDERCMEGTTTSYRPAPLVRGTSFTFDFVGEQPGRWRVYAVDARGDAGLPSPWRYFRFTV